MSGDTARVARIARNPGGTKKAQLERRCAMPAGGYTGESGKHEIWTNGSATVPVPRTLKGTWTVGDITRRVLAAEEASDGR